MNIGASEKKRWLADLIFRVMRQFEDDTGESIDDVLVSRIDGKITSVKINVRRQHDHG